MADQVHRVTMFKVPSKENQAKIISAYARVGETNQKASIVVQRNSSCPICPGSNGKPYIQSLVVGLAEDDPRSQGYTVVCKTQFASLDDMKFYDTECAAHAEFKSTAKTLGMEGMMMVYFTPGLYKEGLSS